MAGKFLPAYFQNLVGNSCSAETVSVGLVIEEKNIFDI